MGEDEVGMLGAAGHLVLRNKGEDLGDDKVGLLGVLGHLVLSNKR